MKFVRLENNFVKPDEKLFCLNVATEILQRIEKTF